MMTREAVGVDDADEFGLGVGGAGRAAVVGQVVNFAPFVLQEAPWTGRTSSTVCGRTRRSFALGVLRMPLCSAREGGDARPDSDTDIMIEIDPAARVMLFNYVGLKDTIASLFDGPVDVVDRAGLKPYVRPAATTDAIYAF